MSPVYDDVLIAGSLVWDLKVGDHGGDADGYNGRFEVVEVCCGSSGSSLFGGGLNDLWRFLE